MKKEEKKKKVIYCWFCGTENDSKRKKCISCGEKLKEKDHPVFVWLFGEIKGEIGDNVLSYICELLSSFFQLHLYGVTIGLAIAFSVVSSVLNFTEPENVEITTNEYALPAEEVVVEEPVEEPKEEETPKEETTTPKPATPKPVTPKPVTPTPKPSTPSTPSVPATPSTPQEKPKELYCPNGYTMRSDNKCESNTYTEALKIKECPTGYNKETSGGETFCISNSPYATTDGPRYCPSTISEYIEHYGTNSCIRASTYIEGVLNSDNTCTYTYYDADRKDLSCEPFTPYVGYYGVVTEIPCPSGMYQHSNYCYLKQELEENPYCWDETIKKYVLNKDDKCREVIDPLER